MQLDARQRIAVIDYDSCNPKKCGNWLCEQVCPVNRTGKECIVHKGKDKPAISELLCIGCLICEKKCPFRAISIVNLSMQLGKPIHQYGENLFRLHRLPLPRERSVVGLVGVNGIGKTTAIRILSGELVPNLGELEEKPGWEKVIEFFRGRAEQQFFEQLSGKKVKVAVKPQNVDRLPKAVKGKVSELLGKVEKGKRLQEVVEKLELGQAMDSRLKELSGGELQKVAIAATALKKADLYFFDEASSYLDIRERMRVAGFIREIAAGGKSVMVVEHDLILLDYLSDSIHLMYGRPSVFGVVSQVKTTRGGINTYLEGYSREENYRFRQHAIEFSQRAARQAVKTGKLAEWPDMQKKLGKFRLQAKGNSVNRGEVIGILGPNAIGKTTFVRMLAGALKPDKGRVELNLRVAYKPQYLSTDSSETVQDALQRDIKDLQGVEVQNSIVKPLTLQPLLEKELGQLSGGELQRVAIASTLAKESELILLDEPSAHLDVEQRLAVAKAIRAIAEAKGRSALVVDHDLLFVDYIADRLMVFSGKGGKSGEALGPFPMEEGMNRLLQRMGITLRRDKKSKRPRINKQGSVLDREQKQKGNYYYA